MAVTLATLQTEVQGYINESTTATNGLVTAALVLAAHNMFLDEYEQEMELPLAPVSYTWGTTTTAVALTSVSATVLQVNQIELLNSDGNVTGTLLQRPRGASDGFYLWNDSVYLNPDGAAPDDSLSTKWWCFRSGTRATTTSANADVHSGSERAVLIPYLLSKVYEKDHKPATADGYARKAAYQVKRMMKKRHRQSNPSSETIDYSDAYAPQSG